MHVRARASVSRHPRMTYLEHEPTLQPVAAASDSRVEEARTLPLLKEKPLHGRRHPRRGFEIRESCELAPPGRAEIPPLLLCCGWIVLRIVLRKISPSRISSGTGSWETRVRAISSGGLARCIDLAVVYYMYSFL